MTSCEMCGRSDNLVAAKIEGTQLKVCSRCSAHGIVKRRINILSKSSYNAPASNPLKEEAEETITPDFSSIIRSKREKLGLSQEDFAKSINERESIVAKWEQNTLKPSIPQARMLERKLGINLVKLQEIKPIEKEKNKASKEFTLGDFIKNNENRTNPRA